MVWNGQLGGRILSSWNVGCAKNAMNSLHADFRDSALESLDESQSKATRIAHVPYSVDRDRVINDAFSTEEICGF